MAGASAHRGTASGRARAAFFAVVVAVIAAGVVAGAPAGEAHAAIHVRSDRPAFTVVVPDGFTESPRPHGGRSFAFTAPGSAGGMVVASLRPLRGTIANERMTLAQARAAVQALVPGADVSVEYVDAGGLEVSVVVARAPGGEVTAVASLPTAPQATQLTVSGARADEAMVRRTARAIAGSFRTTRTNWLTRAQVARKTAARPILLLGWALVAAFGVAWVFRFRKVPPRRPVRAVWLGASAALLLAGAALVGSLPKGASAFEPATPAAVGVLLAVNALLALRREE